MVVKIPPMSRKPWLLPLVSRNPPTISPLSLIPLAKVFSHCPVALLVGLDGVRDTN